MLISVEEAEQLVRSELERLAPVCGCELGLLSEVTIIRPLVCAFFYQSQEYIRTREFSAQLVGHGPLLVNRVTGEVLSTGSRPSPEKQIEELEAKISVEGRL